MTPQQYIDYFRSLAESHYMIQHSESSKRFCRIDVNELATGLSSSVEAVNKYILTLEAFEGTLLDNRADNLLPENTGAFMILRKAAIDDFGFIDKVIDEAHGIGLDFAARMIKDSHDFDAVPSLRGLKRSSFEWHKVGPIFDQLYGYRFSFTITDKIGITYNPAAWL